MCCERCTVGACAKVSIPLSQGFVSRTFGYRLHGAQAALSLRSLCLLNGTEPTDLADAAIIQGRLREISGSMRESHTLNFVSPISSQLSAEFLQNKLVERSLVDGRVENQTTNFNDFTNNYITSILKASYATLAELQSMSSKDGEKIKLEEMSPAKQAVAHV